MDATYLSIKLNRSVYGFGFSISGGLNLNEPICIYQISSDGPAANDGKLKGTIQKIRKQKRVS